MRDLPQFARFWMICRKPTGYSNQTCPTTRYSTLADAKRAARLLANQEDAKFLILETVGVVEPGAEDQKGLDL